MYPVIACEMISGLLSPRDKALAADLKKRQGAHCKSLQVFAEIEGGATALARLSCGFMCFMCWSLQRRLAMCADLTSPAPSQRSRKRKLRNMLPLRELIRKRRPFKWEDEGLRDMRVV